MPSRRDREKADATRTPFADLAPEIPTRDADYVPDEPTTDAPATNAARIPDDDMLPESSATMPATEPETDTTPANVRSRPHARKIATRTAIPAVPRTIAEMQAQESNEAVTPAGSDADFDDSQHAEDFHCFISVPRLFLTTLAVYAALSLLPPIAIALYPFLGFTNIAPLLAIYPAALMVGCIIVGFALPRIWQTAFHEKPSELRFGSIIDLWHRRSRGVRTDPWLTGALGILGVFVVVIALSILGTAAVSGSSAFYRVPLLLVSLIARALTVIAFVGYLYRGLRASYSEIRSVLLTGLYLGVCMSIVLYLAALSAPTTPSLQLLITSIAVTIIVAFASTWLRARTRSVYAPVALMTLFLFGS